MCFEKPWKSYGIWGVFTIIIIIKVFPMANVIHLGTLIYVVPLLSRDTE